MKLGAVTHFSQGWNTSLLASAPAMGATSIRDSISWATVEKSPGIYDFSDPRVAYVQKAIAQGIDVTLVFSSTNPLYDGGTTPNSPMAVEALGNFVKAALAAFPGVRAIEIGNEFNGNNFVTGSVLADAYSLRDENYMTILKAVAPKIATAFPDVKILGGAAHSIPVGYLTELFNKGALDLVDGITIHPYTTAPEQLADQLGVLKAAMGAKQVPIYVTEFGQNFKSLDEAPAYLLKMASVMAGAGVAEADWYALLQQKWFANMELVDKAGMATPGGKAFEFIQNVLLKQGNPQLVSTDSASYFYQFGDRIMVLWGENQTVKFPDGTKYYTATGQLIPNFNGKISLDNPIIAISDAALVYGKTVVSSGTGIVADSFHDFDVTNAKGSTSGYEGPWSYFQLSGTGKMAPLYTMSGGTRADEPWTPYIGTESLRPLRLDANAINPVDFSDGTNASARYAIVERFTSQKSERLTINGHWDVSDKSTDGVDLTILHNQKIIYQTVIYNKSNGNVLDKTLTGIDVLAGDTIDFIVGSNKSSGGSDLTERRITILRESASGETSSSNTPALSSAPASPRPPAEVPLKGTPNGTYQATQSDGAKVAASYDANGVIKSIKKTYLDGSFDKLDHTSGVLTSKTQVHADKTKDVFLSNVTGRTYTAEHDRYDAAGILVETTRTHADGTLDYRYVLGADGTKTTDRYDAAGVIASHTEVRANGYSDTQTFTGGILTKKVVVYAPGSAEASNAKLFTTAGVLTSETQVHADKTKDVFLSNVTGRTYTAEHDRYDAAGILMETTRTHADGTLDYHYVLGADGTKTTDRYDAAGVIASHTEVRANGYSDTQTFTGGILTKKVVVYAPGGAEASNVKLFTTAGVLNSETQVHADKTKDVFLSNVAGRAYTAEHDRYDAAGILVETTRTHADGTLDYRYVLGADGTKTTDRYDAAGVIASHTEVRANGYSDTQTYTNVRGHAVLTVDTIKYASGEAETSKTKLYAIDSGQPVLVTETQIHADKTKDVFHFNVKDANYASDHYAYSANGKLATLDVTYLDGSHAQTAYQAGQTLISTPGVVDAFKSFGGDTFVFASSFGKDVITGLRAGSGAGHDVLVLDQSQVSSFADLQASHLSVVGKDTLLTLSPTDTILLKNVAPATLTADDFRFQDHGTFHV